MSSYSNGAIGNQVEMGGGTRFLEKPVPMATLLHMVRAVLDEP